MSAVRRLRAPWSLLVALAAAATVPVLGVTGIATAEAPASTTETVVGEFVQVWPEYEEAHEVAAHGDEGPLSFVRTEEGDSVRVDTEDVRHLEVGATVELTVGREVSDTASEELGYDEAREVLETEVLAAEPTPPPTAPASEPFTNEVTVVLVVPAGGTRDATTLDRVVTEVNGPVADFWETQSNGAIRIGVTASHDWMTTKADCREPFALWDEVADRVGFGYFPGEHLLLYVTSTPGNLAGCAYGLGTVGTHVGAGGLTYARDVKTSLIAHEFGHNFGLGHSSALQCDSSIHEYDGGTYYKSCGRTAYWDLYDVMGASWDQVGSLNVVQARRIYGFSEKIFEPYTAPETVTLAPVSQQSGVRAIVLRNAKGTQYLLEFRPAAGQDSWIGTSGPSLQSGVLLRKQVAGSDTSLLLDATPSPSAGWSGDSAVALPEATPIRVYDDYYRGGAAFVVTVQSTSELGAIVQVTPTSPIDFAHQAAGGDAGVMGPPTSAETCVDRMFGGRYCERTYQQGGIYWNLSTGARRVTAPAHASYVAAGGVSSGWGLPRTDTSCGLVDGGCVQSFESRLWAYSPSTGEFGIRDAIATHWKATGAESGTLGYPTADRSCNAGICEQPFQRGMVVWSSDRGARSVHGPIRDLWTASGGVGGPLGFPTSDPLTVPGGTAQAFDGGSVYESAGTGAHMVRGAIRSAWWATGGVTGPLGFPTADPVDVGGGTTAQFAGGAVYSSPSAGTHVLRGRVLDAFVGSGGVTGPLGFPVSGVLAVPGGSAVAFAGGSIYESPSTGAHVVRGAIRAAWWATGGLAGPLGFPISDHAAVPGGFAAAFQGGSIYESATTGARTVRGDVRSAWWASGGVTGPLGFPTSDLLTVPGGTAQAFTGGSVYSSPATGAHALPTPVLAPWWATGGVSGPFGFPVSGLLTVPGGSAVAFQGGSVYDSPATGARAISGPTRSAWWAAGGVTGTLGFPRGSLLSIPGGTAQAFSGGWVYSSPGGGTRAVPTALQTPWWAAGGEGGPMGFPTSDVLTVPGGTAMAFAGGSVYAADGQPAYAVYGPTRSAWWATGGMTGSLGPLTGNTTVSGSRSSTRFVGGLLATTGTGVLTVGDPFMQAVDRVGGLAAVGFPIGAEGAVPGGRAQAFERASVYWSADTGARVVSGPLRSAWWASGGVSGPYGYPTGDVVDVAPGEQSLAFATGTLHWSSTTGTRFVAN